MDIQPWVLAKQTDHGAHQAQLTASAAARCDPPQKDAGLGIPPQQQPGRQTRYDQQRDSHQRKQPRPGGNRFDARLGKAQPPFRVAKAGLNGMITNDKFCCTRWGKMPLSWWRRPLRLRC